MHRQTKTDSDHQRDLLKPELVTDYLTKPMNQSKIVTLHMRNKKMLLSFDINLLKYRKEKID